MEDCIQVAFAFELGQVVFIRGEPDVPWDRCVIAARRWIESGPGNLATPSFRWIEYENYDINPDGSLSEFRHTRRESELAAVPDPHES
jgi:hypothetical protein